MEAQVAPRPLSLGFEPDTRARALEREWLETDASGAYASSTLLCANTRRYHGLLVAQVPGLGRHVFLSWLEEWLEDWVEEWAGDWFVAPDEAPERGSYASCALFAGAGLWPGPLVEFERGPISTFRYAVGGLRLTKEVFLLRGRRTVAVSYLANGPCRLRLRPFFACRHFHHLTRHNPQADLSPRAEGPWRIVQPYPELPPVYLSASGHFTPEPAWYLRFTYPQEAARGFEAEEDLLSPGWIRIELEAGQRAWLVVGLEKVSLEEAQAAHEAELTRRTRLISGRDDLSAQLALAADQFLIDKPEGPSVIAGYHWFEEWGRDLLLSLPGLLLVDDRTEDALAALSAFGKNLQEGLLPNRLLEEGGADYEAADVPLLYLLACQRVAEKAGLAAVAGLWPTIEAVTRAYQKGTTHGIGIAPDGLPTQGQSGLALTWMDACVAGEPVTPRSGKAVELAALWFNGLHFAAELADHLGRANQAAAYREAAARTKEGFEKGFWNEERGCCYDVLGEEGPDPAIRPNQLFAVGLPHPLLAGERAARVLETVERELLTPYGLRSLAPGEPGYVSHYGGGADERDRAYHQGTVWPWLLGIYADACLKVRGREGLSELREGIVGMLGEHLRSAGVGSVSELFGAEPPHTPGGCIAQAWSVAELRRVLKLTQED